MRGAITLNMTGKVDICTRTYMHTNHTTDNNSNNYRKSHTGEIAQGYSFKTICV